MRTILLSGFGPFLKHSRNPSQVLSEKFSSLSLSNSQVASITLPVSYESAYHQLKEKIAQCTPNLILMLGLSASRSTVCLERQAINLIDCQQPDNTGAIVLNTPIQPDGQEFLLSRYPLDKLLDYLQANNYTAVASEDAGQYVCNYLYYQTLHHFPAILSLFIHIPAEDLETTEQTLSAIIRWSDQL